MLTHSSRLADLDFSATRTSLWGQVQKVLDTGGQSQIRGWFHARPPALGSGFPSSAPVDE